MITLLPSLNPLWRAGLVAATALGCTGCVSTKYQSAPADVASAVPVNLAATHRAIDATLDTVIILNGPGAWKRAAYWDEYVVTVSNRGRAAATIESAELVDFDGRTVRPGDDPWALEEETADWWHRQGADTMREIQRGVATAGLGVALVMYGLPALTAASVGYPGAAAQVLGAGAVPIAVPSVLLLGTEGDVEARQKIEDTFQARRLKLPRTVATAREARGSLFFPITPGPRQLRLVVRADGKLTAITIDLTAISHLHGAAPHVAVTPERDPNDLRIVPATLYP
jgi:hypothetical protein